MSLVSQVLQKVNGDCLAQRCRKNNCSLTLDDLPDLFILVDMDHKKAPTLSEEEKKCDYIFIGDKDDAVWVAPLELKGGKFKASEVVEQLQSGARVADHIVPSRSADSVSSNCRPWSRRIHRAEQKRPTEVGAFVFAARRDLVKRK